ncbi:uncharacterized protein LTR77_001168 [Saxophila tyrrhenica]|uniref:C3H1-type domain-containing protein n=1 Tax=Saxophila tyrrhenica TaxID=1690608 RepID=A0AAV9PJR2_9PEZI|nr:hypothetical protein LTR77_001168 [Saxophila tyrrhenica]
MSSGFTFPPPPPPPPKPSQPQQQYGGPDRGGGRGRGGSRGEFNQRGRGHSGGRGNSYSNGSLDQPNGRDWRGNQYQNPSQANGYPRSQQYDQSSSSGFPGRGSGVGNGNTRAGGNYGPNGAHAGSPSRSAAGHKRKLDALRGPADERVKVPGPKPAPAVPSFGGPILPPRPAHAADGRATAGVTSRPAVRGLGLVPAADDVVYEESDSEEEKDVDEEALYAELGDKLTFEHNGVVMSLTSQADLEAWRKERQKNWPTTDRMSAKEEDRRRIGVERRRLLAGAEVLQRSSQRGSSKSKAKHLSHDSAPGNDGSRKEPDNTARRPKHDSEAMSVTGLAPAPQQANAGSETSEAKDSAERRKNDRAEQLAALRRKVAESEETNRLARARIEGLQQAASAREPGISAAEEQTSETAEVLDGEAEQSIAEAENAIPGADESHEAANHSSADLSSGVSSSTSEDPEADSDDDAPEEVTSKAPIATTPAHEAPICRYFAASGYCRDGDTCAYRHVQRPERAAQQEKRKEKKPSSPGLRPEKMTIFQRLVEQEQAEADRLALQVIKYLGSAGLFKQELSAD